MLINRHNYEEFFILYMDNELCPDDRRMLEAFVRLHPDLKEELDILLQYKMVPDTTVRFEGKEELLKENGNSLITLSNYEEWLSLYIDDELNPEQKTSVENFITGNPSVQKELALLQRTKLQPGTIVFDHKASLYRREEKVRSIPVRWWRAAAAVLLLTAGLSAVFILNKKPAGTDGVVKTTPGAKEIPAENTEPVQPGKNKTGDIADGQTNTPVVNPPAENETDQPLPENKENDKKALAVKNKKTAAPENVITGNYPSVIKKDEPLVAENNLKPSNNLPQPQNNPNTTISKPDDALAYTTLPEKNQLRNATANNIVTSPTAQPSNIVQASFKENEDAVLDQPDGKKNKNRGIFRKIARTFEKRTNIDPTDDENRLLVGGLAIRLK